jgi:hypothetical protein
MRIGTFWILLGLGILLTAEVVANDSSATLGAGGLVFTKQDGIRMTSEDLHISPKSAQIQYEFTNVS